MPRLNSTSSPCESTGPFAISRKHCQRYVDEFTFRLNQGNCEVDTIERMEAFAKSIGGKRVAYKDLVS